MLWKAIRAPRILPASSDSGCWCQRPTNAAPTSGGAAAQAQVVVSSKIDTEGGVLGNIIKQVLESNDISVENRIQLGATPIKSGTGRAASHRRRTLRSSNLEAGEDIVKNFTKEY